MKPVKYLLSLVVAMLLLAVIVVPVSADAGDTTVTANLEESITINAPTGAYHLTLSASTDNQTLITATGNVTANVDYDVIAVDKGEDGKADADMGYMTEHYDTTTWGATKLTNRVEVGSNHAQGVAATFLNTGASPEPITIISEAPANPGTPVDSLEVVQVTTVGGDAPLATADHWYKITITFTASKHTA